MSFRTALTSALRPVSSSSSSAIRRSVLLTSTRSLSSLRTPLAKFAPLALTSSSSLVLPRSFSTSRAVLGGGETDASLSAKLAEELAYETDSSTALAGQLPDWLADFKEAGVWKIVDQSGSDEVSLERRFGNEK